ncbi:hypothetical protein L1276_003737 [Flavobacterium sp. HSC-32F16]|uniref:hypothetical protein n=1 Tax=Flavobacterium sp. HSC-32F16 TaxID=2910964 RepID=UPI0020A5295D|nr:hypothetical protein [Flavobacterium sp. HSC-32F16]MCP2028567.1 hypothetical protein [Flavobacterium sp. HSC-32F16]
MIEKILKKVNDKLIEILFNRKARKDFFYFAYLYKRKVRKAVSTQSFANFLNLILAHDKKILACFAVKNSLHFNFKPEKKET